MNPSGNVGSIKSTEAFIISANKTRSGEQFLQLAASCNEWRYRFLHNLSWTVFDLPMVNLFPFPYFNPLLLLLV
jgi:hypothetical protein